MHKYYSQARTDKRPSLMHCWEHNVQTIDVNVMYFDDNYYVSIQRVALQNANVLAIN